MLERPCKVQLLGMFIAFVLITVGTACAAGDPVLNKKLEDTIAKVRAAKSPEARSRAADYLTDLTYGVDPASVDDKTIADMVALLDDPADPACPGVAGALGLLGPRANVAVPKLLAMLPKADCLWGSLTSAGFIRTALEKMGVEPPPVDLTRCKELGVERFPLEK